MYAFNYERPANLAAAQALLAAGGNALAGGQTMIAAMKQRLQQPETVVDLGAISTLAGIRKEGNNLVIGAMTRHQDVADNAEVRQHIPALAALADGIGDKQIRTMGTLGGSVANNDPAACYPSAVLALGATVHTDDNNKIYRYNGTAWVASFTPFIKTDGSGRVEGLQKADGTDGYWVMVANAFQIWNGTSSEAPFEVVGGFTYIKSAIIQNAAIGTAHIQDAAVQTLKIAGNAVTIPLSDTRSGSTITGSGSYVEVCSVDILCPVDMPLLCFMSSQQGYTGSASWGCEIKVDGSLVTNRGGLSPNDAPMAQKTVWVTAGWHTVTGHWYGQNSSISTNENELAVFGAAR